MIDTRPWAARRRFIILTFIWSFLAIVAATIFFVYFYQAPTCFDNEMNGKERAVDCGGDCVRICAMDVMKPAVLWAESFKIVDGQYNVVAYVENRNRTAGTPELSYTMTLEDAQGVIISREGKTVLPPDNTYPIFEGRIMTGDRVPTKTTITLGEAPLWLPGTQTRQQFTLIDRGDIQNADGAPRLQSSVKNNALVPAKNAEVVATIFDSEGTALTASRTFLDFPAQSASDVIFTWPEPIAKTLRSCEVPTDVMLAIDLSGSMNNLGGVPPEPLASVKRAAEAFVSRLGKRDRVGVVTFATNAQIVTPLTPNTTDVASAISRLAIPEAEETGSTNSGAAMPYLLSEFASDRHNPDARKVVVLLTDGLTNDPEPDPEAFALAEVLKLKDNDINIFTIGLGEDINDTFLRQMASTPEQYFRTLSAQQVDQIYRDITAAICEEGAARIDIIPKTNTAFPEWP